MVESDGWLHCEVSWAGHNHNFQDILQQKVQLTFHNIAEATAIICRTTPAHSTVATAFKERSRCTRARVSIGISS